ncbi:MAG: hypothetical protein QOK43_1277 [Acidimicrobiaceae bacterium]|nr:hypothetical protein [Acidimicrobiaceae bacterium]
MIAMPSLVVDPPHAQVVVDLDTADVVALDRDSLATKLRTWLPTSAGRPS